MRVRDAYTRFDPTAPRERTQTPAAKDAEETSAAAPATTLSLSGKAQELAARSVKVEALRDALQRGAFVIDAKKIAAKLVGGDEG